MQGGNFSASSGVSLYTGSALLSMSNKTLFTYSTATSPSGISLFASQGFQQSPQTLFVHGNTSTSSGIPLYVGSARFISTNVPLYVNAAVGSTSGNITLYVGASSVVSNHIPLVVQSNQSTSQSVTLYTQAGAQLSPPITLYLLNIASGSNAPHGEMYLYTKGLQQPTSTSGTSLFLANTLTSNTPGLNGIYRGIPAYLEGGRITQSMPLYLGTSAANTNPSGFMPLFIGTPLYTGYYNSNITLYVANEVSGFSSPLKRLFIRGDGTLAGGSIASANMPLFLQQTGVTPVTHSASNNITMYTNSAIVATSGVPLYAGGKGGPSSGVSAYVYGKDIYSSGISMYVGGRDLALINNITTYINGF
jgi:hypothetical protein